MSELEGAAESILEQQVSRFDSAKGTDTPVPKLKIIDGRENKLDIDGYAILIGEEGWEGENKQGDWSEENLSEFFHKCIKGLYDKTVNELAEDIADELLRKYDDGYREPEIYLSEDISFEDLDYLAVHDYEDSSIKIDMSLMEELNPKSADITGKTLEPLLNHELAHSLYFTTNPNFKPLIDETVVEGTQDYVDNVGRAPIEAIAVYEQFKTSEDYLEGSSQHQAFQAILNPWLVPEIEIEVDNYYSDNPYVLGALGAFGLENSIEENSEDHTRKKLLNITHPQYLNDYIDLFFKNNGLPNYPKIFQKNYQELLNLDGKERKQKYVESVDQINRNYQEGSYENLSIFLEHRALIDAYQRLNKP